ncbi:GntR family transcriptional regulator [Tissierella creatinophila]|uniref:HTH-type transcriptional repressor YtrA n=1 Tax=Tissierella creatinophila DSM 6911 TaxID=1123403 RepID=A0A1U7M628_TISCR|nr:GntR family transcriptional regulator [Tissierella creatinophila]OLS02757.1 HTH-type transcriptional repressor YtrA [Tissierella creatinophila DSM 6911]
MFNINTTSDKPIYEQIIDNIKELSLKKILRPEDKLPSVRQMASMLVVNPNTVSKAYQELERQKIIHTVRGRGTFISSETDFPVDKDRIAKALETLRDICIELGHLGFDREKIIKEIERIYCDIEKGGIK